MWFFRPNHRHLKRLYQADLMGKSCPPIPDLVHSQRTAISKESCSQGLKQVPLLALHTSLTYICIRIPASPLGDLFNQGTWKILSLLCHSIQYFPTPNPPSFLSFLALQTNSVPFVWWSLNLSQPHPHTVPWWKPKRRELTLSLVSASSLNYCSNWLKTWLLLSFWLVFNQLFQQMKIQLVLSSSVEILTERSMWIPRYFKNRVDGFGYWFAKGWDG